MNRLIKSDDPDTEKTLNAFKRKLEDSEVKLGKASQDASFKKFKRIAFGILSISIYAVYRAKKVGSAAFWKTKRDVFKHEITHKVNKALKKPLK